MGTDLLKIGGNDDGVHGTGAKICPEQALQYKDLGEFGEFLSPFWSVRKGDLGDFGKTHGRPMGAMVQCVAAFYL